MAGNAWLFAVAGVGGLVNEERMPSPTKVVTSPVTRT